MTKTFVAVFSNRVCRSSKSHQCRSPLCKPTLHAACPEVASLPEPRQAIQIRDFPQETPLQAPQPNGARPFRLKNWSAKP